MKNPSDFVGDVLGASEQRTKGILSSTFGKVLVIDEAYGLYSSTTGQSADPYKTAVIETLVAGIQSVPGDDRCVLLLGYHDDMETMLRNANPGLARRFPMSGAFHFQDFTDDELGRRSQDEVETASVHGLSRGHAIYVEKSATCSRQVTSWQRG